MMMMMMSMMILIARTAKVSRQWFLSLRELWSFLFQTEPPLNTPENREYTAGEILMPLKFETIVSFVVKRPQFCCRWYLLSACYTFCMISSFQFCKTVNASLVNIFCYFCHLSAYWCITTVLRKHLLIFPGKVLTKKF